MIAAVSTVARAKRTGLAADRAAPPSPASLAGVRVVRARRRAGVVTASVRLADGREVEFAGLAADGVSIASALRRCADLVEAAAARVGEKSQVRA